MVVVRLTKFKIVIIVVFILGLGLSGILYHAAQRFRPEDVRLYAIKAISDIFPGAKVSIGKIDYSIGTSIKFKLLDLDLKLKNKKGKGAELSKLKDLDIKIPIWSLITGGGRFEINIKRPVINYYEFAKKKSNWVIALGKNTKVTQSQTKKKKRKKGSKIKKDDGSVTIPPFLYNSKLNIKLEDVNFFYRLSDGSKGHLDLSRFIVKNLNLTEPTAFELALSFNSSTQKKKGPSLDVQLIGQTNLGDFLDNQKLSSSMVLTISKIKGVSGIKDVPNLKINLKSDIFANGDIKSKIVSQFGAVANVETDVSVVKKKINVNNFKTTVNISELINLLVLPVPMDFSKTNQFTLNGNLFISEKKIVPNFKFGLKEEIKIQVNKEVPIQTMVKGSYVKNKFELNVTNKLLEGNLAIAIKTKFDLIKDMNLLKKFIYPKVDVKIEGSHLNIKKEIMQEILYKENGSKSSSKKNNKIEPKTAKKKKKKNSLIMLPHVNLQMALKKIKIGGEELSTDIKILIAKNKIASRKFNLKFRKGYGKIKFLHYFKNSGDQDSTFSVDIKKMNLNILHAFLPRNVENIKGVLSGSVKGKTSLKSQGQVIYNVNANITAKDGEIKGLNIKKYVKQMVSYVPLIKNKVKDKDINISDEFETFVVRGKFKHTKMDIKRIHFIGIKKKVEIKGNGVIYPISKTKKGVINLNFKDKKGKFSKILRKEIGTETIPVRLTGYQFELRPDYAYTIKQLTKKAAKTQVKKRGKKAVKKITDKLLDGKKNKKLKKLIEGLF